MIWLMWWRLLQRFSFDKELSGVRMTELDSIALLLWQDREIWTITLKSRARQRKCNKAHWWHETLPIIMLRVWLLWHQRAAIFLYWSGRMLHFLTCQHGQAKHGAFWHWHFSPLSHTDNSNWRQAWHGDIQALTSVLRLCFESGIRSLRPPYNVVKKVFL